MTSMKPPQKDLYGNPIDSTSSSQSPEVDISFAFDKEEPSSSDVSNIYSETNSAGKLSNGKGKLISSKEEHVRPATDITKSNIWDIIFGTKRIAYGNKRGYTRRCSSYCSDITLSNFSNAALTSLVVVVAPIVQKNRLHNKIRDLAVKGAIENDPNAPKIPPTVDLRCEIESAIEASFAVEFSKQLTLVAIRKLLIKVIRSLASEKFADKFSRDFYPKLRRTVNRYGAYKFTTLGKVFIGGVYTAIPFYTPQFILQSASHIGGFLYRFLCHEVDFADIDFDDVYVFTRDKLKKLCYMVLRDALIRSSLLIIDPFLNPVANELTFVGLSLITDEIPMSTWALVGSKLREAVDKCIRVIR